MGQANGTRAWYLKSSQLIPSYGCRNSYVPKSNNGKTLPSAYILKIQAQNIKGETYLSTSGKFVQPEGQPNDQL